MTIDRSPRGSYVPELKTSVIKISYSFDTHSGEVQMAAGGSADMDGVIAYFTRLDALVWRIGTFRRPLIATRIAGIDWESDTVYERGSSGNWRAL